MTTRRIFTGKNVQEATDAALAALDAELEDVDIRVVNPGRAGIFGLGGALAEIEVAKVSDLSEETDDEAEPQPQRRQSSQSGRRRNASSSGPGQRSRSRRSGSDQGDDGGERPASSARRGRQGGGDRAASSSQSRTRRQGRAASGRSQTERRSSRGSNRPASRSRPARMESAEQAAETQPRKQDAEQEPVTLENRAQLEEMTGEIIGFLIASMNVQVDAYVLEELRNGSLVFELEGEDAGLLIGRRGETLRDLQLIARLLVSRQLAKRANIIVDVEQYQMRRYSKLENLAESAAKSAARGRAQALEPMSAEERRVVHMALSSNPQVMTESEGEGEDRHVVIKPT